MSQLDSSRAEAEDSVIEVAISLLAVDRLLGNTEDSSNAQSTNKQATSKVSATAAAVSNVPKKTMKSCWMKWIIEHHTFNQVVLSDTDYDSFSGAVKEYLYEDNESNTFQLLSLKYHTPSIPKKPGEKSRPLTNDQKYQNFMFMREAKKLWKRAKDELESRVIEFIAKGIHKSSGMKKESEIKHKMSQNLHQRDTEDVKKAQERYLEVSCLHELSLKQLKAWIEIDEDKKLTEENRQLQEKMKEAKAQHEGWLKEKDR